MCNCPSQRVVRSGFYWREYTHKQDCTTPSPDTLVGYFVGLPKGDTIYPTVKTSE